MTEEQRFRDLIESVEASPKKFYDDRAIDIATRLMQLERDISVPISIDSFISDEHPITKHTKEILSGYFSTNLSVVAMLFLIHESASTRHLLIVANYLHVWAKRNGREEIGLDDVLIEIFPSGLPVPEFLQDISNQMNLSDGEDMLAGNKYRGLVL